MLKATLLLPNYNNERVLPVMFSYLRKNVNCPEVGFVMVDDGSEDDGLRVAKEELAKTPFGSAEIIELKHEGIVNALNVGLDAVRTDLVMRIDGDATVETRGWVDRLSGWLERYPEVGIVGGHVIFEDDRVHSFGRQVVNEFGLYDMGCTPTEPFGRRTYDGVVYRPKSGFIGGSPYEADSVLGVCVGFRKSEAIAVGKFDTRFSPVWTEDDDFGLSIRHSGKRVVIDPAVQVVHRLSLRNSRQPGTTGTQRVPWTVKRVRDGVARRIRKVIPKFAEAPKAVTWEDLVFKETNPWRIKVLQSHYKAWFEKWKFDIVNPNMIDIYNKYWDNALCWKQNPTLLESSIRFLNSVASHYSRTL